MTAEVFEVELKWHNLTHACYCVYEHGSGDEVGHVVILAENMNLFEALFSERALDAARKSLELPA